MKPSLTVVAGEQQVTVSADAANEADLKLAQIRAIADLIGTVDKDMLYEDAVELASHTICDLVTEVREILDQRKPVQP